MATITTSTHIDIAPAAAWHALRDFANLHTRLAAGFVTDCRVDDDDPDVRTVTFANGAVARERLVTIDDERRQLVYTVVESGLHAEHDSSVATITADGDGTCFTWTKHVLPDSLAPVIDGLMAAGVTAIKQTLERATIAV